MFSYDYSMIEGPPLQYYSYAPLSPPVNHFYHPYHQRHSSDFDLQYLNRFGVPSYDWMSSSEEINMPRSPTNSNQSDSDNSQSSIELSSSARRNVIVSPSSDRLAATTIQVPNSTVSKSTDNIQCCWHTCGLEFESLDALATHVSKVHSASGPGGLFYCGWEGCTRNNRGFNARYKMLVHVRTHTNEKPHQCWQCDKSFSRAENLKIHIRSHSGEKPYVCPVAGCAKAYSNSSDRFKHTRTHQVDKPYQCKIPGCSKRYTDPSSLRKHVKTYKHFVNNENQQEIPPPPPTNNRLEEVTMATDCLIGTTSSRNNDLTPELVPHMRTSADISFSTCIQCCRGLVSPDEKLCNRCNSSSELYRIGALFTTGKSWRIAPSTKLFTPYDLQECKMDVEMPLDLSMAGRRQTSNVL